MSRAHIFIRNDDVWTLDKEFRFFFDLAMESRIPVVHAVIPGKMDKALIRFLCKAKERTPALLDIVQHGWVHANHSDEADKKYEFGRSRSYAAQAQDIDMGKERMQAAFGDLMTPAFVPPFHGYDQQTQAILNDGFFKLFSAGSRGLDKKSGLLELPATISFSSYGKNTKPSIKLAADVVEILAINIRRVPLSGVVTHHEDFTTMASRMELTNFFRLLAVKKAREEWRVVLFSDLQDLRNNEARLLR